MPSIIVKQDHTITKQAFDDLLNWLDLDRDQAAAKYEHIRGSLIQSFRAQGFYDSARLADEVINRVMLKVPEVASTYTGDPTRYFHRVAYYVLLEERAAQRSRLSLDDPSIDAGSIPAENMSEKEKRYEVLEDCLRQLPERHRKLLLEYYADRGRVKIARRKQLAHQLGITDTALGMKVYRLKKTLRKCLEKRLERQVMVN